MIPYLEVHVLLRYPSYTLMVEQGMMKFMEVMLTAIQIDYLARKGMTNSTA